MLQGRPRKLHFCSSCSSWVHKKCSGISGTPKPGHSFRCIRCPGQARQVHGRHLKEVTIGRESLRWCHPSVTSGTAYPQVAVLKSFLSQNAVSHEVNSTSSCPSSPPFHFPSPPGEEFTIRASGAPFSMQANCGPNFI